MSLSAMANILTFLLGNSQTRGVWTTFTNAISSVMMSRLILNLRDSRLSIPLQHSNRTTLTLPLPVPDFDSE
ncbi:hypothetical protein BT96DRAFT_487221 [Gymnopus androsaceus JB14]|uniref:Uncharacterized protein n=1 Tax=Gymnopus androsaceus JB14 TaxID=1447944 RepID=A0A6A4I448_9AGAR|nr:hypothetical protein BT96DRAFT_487221 [Gymnopus androsaceus JB14]